MPEGDVVYRTARRLHQTLSDQPLTGVELRWGSLDGSALVGRRTLEVASRGKHLLHRIESGWTLHSHLRMEGSWRIVATDEVGAGGRDRTRNLQVRAVVANDRWTALGLQLGMLDLVPTRSEDTVVGHLGPDLLGADWDLDLALANLRAHPDLPIGQALLDQRLLCGIGTMYCAETLFLTGTHPWRPVGAFSPDELSALLGKAGRLLTVGTTQLVQSTTGSSRPGEEKYVHGRSGRPCLRCGGTVRVAPIGEPGKERTMFSCPTCQGGVGPTDDGKPQEPLGSRRRDRPPGTLGRRDSSSRFRYRRGG